MRQGGKVMKVPFVDGEWEHGPFRVGAGTGCVYLVPTQGYIAQGKPNKAHTTILEKNPTKKDANGFEQ